MLRWSNCTTAPLSGHPIRLSGVIGCSDDVLGGGLREFSRDGSAAKRHVRLRPAVARDVCQQGVTIWGANFVSGGEALAASSFLRD